VEHCSVTLKSELSKAELQALCELLTSSNLSGSHLEIGTAAGGTLVEMMKCYTQADSLIILKKTADSKQPEIDFMDYAIGILLGPVFNWRRSAIKLPSLQVS